MKQSTLKRFLRMPVIEEHLELHRLDCMSGSKHLENYEFAKRQLEELTVEHLKPAPLLTGTDLIAEGYKPGPIFAEILSTVEDAQLEGRIHTSGEALALVQSTFPR
jgi:poly(A) polymerase